MEERALSGIELPDSALCYSENLFKTSAMPPIVARFFFYSNATEVNAISQGGAFLQH